MTEDESRKAFEAVISAPPYGRYPERIPDGHRDYAWPGQYRDYGMQLCWDIWQAAIAWMQSQQEWRAIDENTPADVDLLLYCPDRGITNEERIELRQFRNTRAGSKHAWATKWLPLPPVPKEGKE